MFNIQIKNKTFLIYYLDIPKIQVGGFLDTVYGLHCTFFYISN